MSEKTSFCLLSLFSFCILGIRCPETVCSSLKMEEHRGKHKCLFNFTCLIIAQEKQGHVLLPRRLPTKACTWYLQTCEEREGDGLRKAGVTCCGHREGPFAEASSSLLTPLLFATPLGLLVIILQKARSQAVARSLLVRPCLSIRAAWRIQMGNSVHSRTWVLTSNTFPVT